MSENQTATRNYRKTREGYVVSDKMEKTVVVEVEDRVKHALYGKILRRTTRYKVHDESNSCGVGDRVRLMETRPLSATKRWRVVEILRSEEHTSELQSRGHIVCRLLLEKKKEVTDTQTVDRAV